MNPIKANYHSHSFRCGHAFGTDEEYVQGAIKAELETMGFSDHVILPGIHQYGMRAEDPMLPDYLESVKALKKKYEGQIEIFTGFECEWFGPVFEGYYRDLLESGKCDYLIIGQHCCMPQFDHMRFYASYADPDAAVKDYTKDLVAGIRSGLFSYVAHPDVIVMWFHRWNELNEESAYAICRAAKEMNIPLEINMSCSRFDTFDLDNPEVMLYPYPRFWEIASEIGNDVIIGVDAHQPNHYDSPYYQVFVDFAKKHRLNLLTRLPFRRPGIDF